MASVHPVGQDPHGNYNDENHGMSSAQHKSAHKHWGAVKAEVKLGAMAKAAKHKKKIAALVTLKITIIVIIVVLTTVVAVAAAANRDVSITANSYLVSTC